WHRRLGRLGGLPLCRNIRCTTCRLVCRCWCLSCLTCLSIHLPLFQVLLPAAGMKSHHLLGRNNLCRCSTYIFGSIHTLLYWHGSLIDTDRFGHLCYFCAQRLPALFTELRI